MPDEQPRTSFWTTLPGIMTGTASLIFALSDDAQRVNGKNQQTQTPLFGSRRQ